ncbi:TPA: gamma-glutamyl-gamma-aminobutyrate hydrolase family protein, partial [Streptococcus pneumoniae]
LAPNFRVTAIDSRDQTIEAIESIDEHRIIGLQWHPEFLVNEEDGNLELFEYLLNEL